MRLFKLNNVIIRILNAIWVWILYDLQGILRLPGFFNHKQVLVVLFHMIFSLAYFSIVCALVFNRLSSLLVSAICLLSCPSLLSSSLEFFFPGCDQRPVLGSKNIIQVTKQTREMKYLFLMTFNTDSDIFIRT